MAKYPSMVITKEGLSMIAESQGGSGLIFTKIALGAGDLNGNSIADLKNLVDLRINANISTIDATTRPGQVTLTSTVSNAGVKIGFHAKELGVFAKIGENGTERLYAYTNAGNYADYMPDKNDPVDQVIFKATFVVSNAQNVSAIIDSSIVYPTFEAMHEAIDAHNTSEGAHGENIASQAEAEAQTNQNNIKFMTPLRVWDAIKKFAISPAFRANIAVSNGTKAGSSSTIQLGIKPSSATMQANIGTDVNGAVILHSTENQGYAFRIGSQVNRLYLTTYNDGIAFKHISTNFATYDTTNGANWLGNAKTATQLETARTINGVAFDGTKDITIYNTEGHLVFPNGAEFWIA